MAKVQAFFNQCLADIIQIRGNAFIQDDFTIGGGAVRRQCSLENDMVDFFGVTVNVATASVLVACQQFLNQEGVNFDVFFRDQLLGFSEPGNLIDAARRGAMVRFDYNRAGDVAGLQVLTQRALMPCRSSTADVETLSMQMSVMLEESVAARSVSSR